MTATNVLSSMPREKLEEQLLKNLKYIKALRKQNEETISSVEELDSKLKNQIEENNKLIDLVNKLQDENEKLIQEQQKSSPSNVPVFGIANIGKTISKVISQKKCEDFKMESNLDVTTIFPTILHDDESDSAAVKALKLELSSLQNKLQTTMESERTSQQKFSEIEEKNKNLEKNAVEFEEQASKLTKENEKLKNENQEMKEKLKSLEDQYSSLKLNNFVMETKMPSLLQAENELKQITESKNSLNEQYEKIKTEVVSLRVKNEENLRQIEQYKDGLKKAMRNDKERENEIHQLHNKIADLEIEKQDLSKQIELFTNDNQNQNSRENQLKSKISELEKRLESGKASEETENKVKKMNQMLEKSSTLYAELQEKHSKLEQRAKDLEIKLHQAKVPGLPIIKFVGPKDFYVLFDNGVFQENIDNSSETTKVVTYVDSKKKDKSTQYEENGQTMSYSEHLMRNYFLSDENARKDISAILMKMLNFSDDEIKRETMKKRSGFHLF